MVNFIEFIQYYSAFSAGITTFLRTKLPFPKFQMNFEIGSVMSQLYKF